MFSLESPHGGDSNVYSQYTIFNINSKITLNYPKSAAMRFFPRDIKTSPTQPSAVVNESSVFEPLKFYCIIHVKTYALLYDYKNVSELFFSQ